eukprot:scaffold1134_cov28-Tisochrysis_lutea.AAC.2
MRSNDRARGPQASLCVVPSQKRWPAVAAGLHARIRAGIGKQSGRGTAVMANTAATHRLDVAVHHAGSPSEVAPESAVLFMRPAKSPCSAASMTSVSSLSCVHPEVPVRPPSPASPQTPQAGRFTRARTLYLRRQPELQRGGGHTRVGEPDGERAVGACLEHTVEVRDNMRVLHLAKQLNFIHALGALLRAHLEDLNLLEDDELAVGSPARGGAEEESSYVGAGRIRVSHSLLFVWSRAALPT